MYSNSIRFLWYMFLYQIADIIIGVVFYDSPIYLVILLLPGIFFLMKAGREEVLYKRIVPVWVLYVICEILSIIVGPFALLTVIDYASELVSILLVCLATARLLERCGEKAYATYAEWLCVIYVLLYAALLLQAVIPGNGLFYGALHWFVNIMIALEYFLLLGFYWKSRRLLKKADRNSILKGDEYDRG